MKIVFSHIFKRLGSFPMKIANRKWRTGSIQDITYFHIKVTKIRNGSNHGKPEVVLEVIEVCRVWCQKKPNLMEKRKIVVDEWYLFEWKCLNWKVRSVQQIHWRRIDNVFILPKRFVATKTLFICFCVYILDFLSKFIPFRVENLK